MTQVSNVYYDSLDLEIGFVDHYMKYNHYRNLHMINHGNRIGQSFYVKHDVKIPTKNHFEN